MTGSPSTVAARVIQGVTGSGIVGLIFMSLRVVGFPAWCRGNAGS